MTTFGSSVPVDSHTKTIPQTIDDTKQETEESDDEQQYYEPEEEPSFLHSFLTSFKTTNFEKRSSIAINISIILALLAIAYYISILLSITLFIGVLSMLIYRWFSSTDMSVEITVFLAKFFPPSKQEYWNTRTTPELSWTSIFRNNYKVIHAELVDFLEKYNYAPEMDDVYPNGSITNWDRKWPTVNLRVYGMDTKVSAYFPKTMAIVNNAESTWISHVMFSILKPYKFIPRHRGPYRGVFRYQLALEIPPCEDPENGLYLSVWPNTSSHEFWQPENVPKGDPTIVTWTDGNDFIFDDTCVHEVHNSTSFRRIILFMDVERFDISWTSKIIHKIFMSAARLLPAVKYAGKVQDKYLDECKDPLTNELKKWDGVVDENRILENNWVWYNTAPEILPFRKARVVIASLEKRGGVVDEMKEMEDQVVYADDAVNERMMLVD